MQSTIAKLRHKTVREDAGFTLIELLVVVVIIGVLVGISVPVYMNYRKGATNKSAASDVRGAISAVEQYYTDNGNTYPAAVTGTEGTNITFTGTGGNQTATVSPGNTLVLANNTTSYVICGQNSDGQTIYVYNSSTGGSVKKSDQTTLAACASAGH